MVAVITLLEKNIMRNCFLERLESYLYLSQWKNLGMQFLYVSKRKLYDDSLLSQKYRVRITNLLAM